MTTKMSINICIRIGPMRSTLPSNLVPTPMSSLHPTSTVNSSFKSTVKLSRCTSCGTFQTLMLIPELQCELRLDFVPRKQLSQPDSASSIDSICLSKKKQKQRQRQRQRQKQMGVYNRSRSHNGDESMKICAVDKEIKKDVTCCKEDNVICDDMYDYKTILSVRCKTSTHQSSGCIESKKSTERNGTNKHNEEEEKKTEKETESEKIEFRQDEEEEVHSLASDQVDQQINPDDSHIECPQFPSRVVDLTQEDCWKQNNSRDKNVQNINRITRYGVGYKKCSSHSHSNFHTVGVGMKDKKEKYQTKNPVHQPYYNQNRVAFNGRHYNGYCKCAHKSYKPNVTCSNCGCYGHLYRNCNFPITSYGIICFRFKTNILTDTITPEFLMVQRHKSLNYVEFMRGKWTLENRKYLMEMFENMTEEERKDIASHSFSSLWKALWKVNDINYHDREYRESKYKFDYLKKGYLYETKDGSRIFIDVDYILDNTTSIISESEWGFPKGKRLNERESDFNCAMREFVEETSIIPKFVEVKSLKPYEEEFVGSNRVRYKHVYYLTHCATNNDTIAFEKDISQVVDIDEIRNVRWFKYTDGVEMIREPNQKRKEIFKQAHTFVLENLDVRQRSKMSI